MQSSASTRSRSPDAGVPLFLSVVGDDHPRACTGRRLLRRGAAERFDAEHQSPRGLLLDPYASVPLSVADRPLARARGIYAVDCSWNRLHDRGGYADGALGRVPQERRRRLPLLLAGNPQHFGRLGELNTAEALAAALVVLGERDRARGLLAASPSGESFLSLNASLLESYATADSAGEILAAERQYF